MPRPIAIQPLTPDRWPVFATLCRQMGPNCGCWCMYWRETPGHAAGRQAAARFLAEQSPAPGLVATVDDEPAGWVACAPRAAYPRLNAGRDNRPTDGTDPRTTWAVPCFFGAPGQRGRDLSRTLLHAATTYAAEHGATAIEGVPVDPATKARSDSASYTGLRSTFTAAGFEEVARRTPRGRVLVRRTLR